MIGNGRDPDRDFLEITNNHYGQCAVICRGENSNKRKKVQDYAAFDFTMSEFSQTLAQLTTEEFVSSVRLRLRAMRTESRVAYSSSEETPDEHCSQKSRRTSSGSMSLDGDNGPASKRKRSSSSATNSNTPEQLKAMRNEPKATKRKEDPYRHALEEALIDGTVSVSSPLLTPGEQFLRSTSEGWVERLKRSMMANGNLYIGAPLVAIVNVPKADFDKTKPNTFTYTVIGGCHRLKAAKELSKEGHKGLETLDVQVYGAEVLDNRKAICWWAHQHNELQAMQLDLKTQDKVQFCREEYLTKNPNWRADCKDMLSLPVNDLTNTILSLAEAPVQIFEILQQLYKKYVAGGLKDLKLKRGEKEGLPDCKPGHFTDLVKIKDHSCQLSMLQEVVAGKKSLKELAAESQDIKRRQTIQCQFLRDTGCQTWEEACNKYPLHTTLEALNSFNGVNFTKGSSPRWMDHVRSAKQYKENQDTVLPSQAYTTPEGHVRGFVSQTKLEDMEGSSAKTQFNGFNGADLVMLNLRDVNDLSPQKMQQIFRSARGLNLDLQKNNFLVLAFLKIADVGMAWTSLKGEATHIEVVYINKTPGRVPPGKGLLHQSVEPVLVIFWSSSHSMPSPVTSLVKRRQDCTNLFSGAEQQITGELIQTFCPTGGWVIASNMKHGGAVVEASLTGNRNAIQLVNDDEEAREAHRQLNAWLAKKGENDMESTSGDEESQTLLVRTGADDEQRNNSTISSDDDKSGDEGSEDEGHTQRSQQTLENAQDPFTPSEADLE